ncbi:MAG: VanZ family protein [Chitinophagaceae bacterium]|nr:VanZ family protein [Chitinophagaceae bacterium]
MIRKEQTLKWLLWLALLFCMMVLAKFILFKKSPAYYRNYFAREYKSYTISKGWRDANLKPFSTIRLFSSKRVSSEYSYKNIGGNIIGFIPLGILLPLLLPFWRSFLRTSGTLFFISLSFEMIQLIAGIGVFDVDDIILNTAGGIAGYMLYATVRRTIRWQEEARAEAGY